MGGPEEERSIVVESSSFADRVPGQIAYFSIGDSVYRVHRGVETFAVEISVVSQPLQNSTSARTVDADSPSSSNAGDSAEQDMSRRIRNLWNHVLRMHRDIQQRGDSQQIHQGVSGTALPRPETPPMQESGGGGGGADVMHQVQGSGDGGSGQMPEDWTAESLGEGFPSAADYTGPVEGASADDHAAEPYGDSVSNGSSEEDLPTLLYAGVQDVGLIVYIYGRQDAVGSSLTPPLEGFPSMADGIGDYAGDAVCATSSSCHEDGGLEPASPPSASAQLLGDEEDDDGMCPPDLEYEDSDPGNSWNIQTLEFELSRSGREVGLYELADEQVGRAY
jgi:hypothetical protein